MASSKPDQDIVQDGRLPNTWKLSQGTTLNLLGTDEIVPAATTKCVQDEVWEKLLQTLHGATQEKIDTLSVCSKEQVEQFWQTKANDHRWMWVDQFFSKEDKYFESMYYFTASHLIIK